MTVEGLAKLIDATAKLFGVLVWPILLGYILVRFGPELRGFASSLGEFTFKAAGFEATAKRRQGEAVAALGAAVAARPLPGATPEITAGEARAAAQIVSELTPQAILRAEGSQVLWVDDKPDGNLHERQALEALGIRVSLAASTDEALTALGHRRFDVIISDMARPSDAQAGCTLLEQLRSNGNQTPIIFYTASSNPSRSEEARKRGALGSTNRASELIKMVMDVIAPSFAFQTERLR